MKRCHACCPFHATSSVANRMFRSLALGSGGFFGLLPADAKISSALNPPGRPEYCDYITLKSIAGKFRTYTCTSNLILLGHRLDKIDRNLCLSVRESVHPLTFDFLCFSFYSFHPIGLKLRRMIPIARSLGDGFPIHPRGLCGVAPASQFRNPSCPSVFFPTY